METVAEVVGEDWSVREIRTWRKKREHTGSMGTNSPTVKNCWVDLCGKTVESDCKECKYFGDIERKNP